MIYKTTEISSKRIIKGDRSRCLFGLAVFLLIASFVGQVVLTGRVATACGELASLEQEKKQLLEENQSLKNKLNAELSLARVKKQAEELGMVSATVDGVDYLTPQLLAAR